MAEHDNVVPERDHATNAHHHGRSTFSNYIIPLTVFLVVAVFVTLILIMGLMDLRRLDRTLVDFMKNRGLDIVATIENVAEEDLDFLRRILRAEHTGYGFESTFYSDTEYHIQERLINALVEVARNIDTHWQQDDLTEADLEKIADQEKLSLIVLLDEDDNIVLQSRKFDHQPFDAPLSLGRSDHEQLFFELLSSLGTLVDMGYIALRRRDGSGTIVIALDAGKLKYWGAKIAVKRVIGDIGWEQELSYLSVVDHDGNILGEVGHQPRGNTLSTDLMARDVLAGQRGVISSKQENGDNHYLAILAPVRLDNAVVGYAHMGLKWDRAQAMLKENRNRMIITTALIVLIGTLSTAGLYRNQSRELARMEEMRARLQRAEQLSTLGQLAAGVAHEIRNPLNAISIATQRLQRDYSPGDEAAKSDFHRISGIIRDEIRRLNEIIEEFVKFFRIKRMELRPHCLEEVLGKILKVMENESADRNILLKGFWNDTDHTMVSMDPDKLTQALVNIIKNALEATDGSERGQVTLAVEHRDEQKVAVMVSDTGSGLTPDEIDRIFSPEYTTKEKGLGLGLTLAHEIIHGHGGEINVASRKGAGTTFEILLPTGRPITDREAGKQPA